MSFDDVLNDLIEWINIEDIEGFPMPVATDFAKDTHPEEEWQTVVESRVSSFKVSYRCRVAEAKVEGLPAKIVEPEVADWGDSECGEPATLAEPAEPAELGMTGDIHERHLQQKEHQWLDGRENFVQDSLPAFSAFKYQGRLRSNLASLRASGFFASPRPSGLGSSSMHCR